MAETHEKPPAAPDTTVGDRDVDAGALYKFMVGLLAVIAVAMAAMWGMSVLFRKELVSSDPPAPVLEEARVRRPPPEPRLEVSPPKDLMELRAREEAILTGWGWTDKEKGLARIPVARAADIIAEKGLPSQAPAIPAGAVGNPAENGRKGMKETRENKTTKAAEGGR
jgi:hypothetical protein